MANLHNSEQEIFLPIKDYEIYYQVSNLGNIKSLGRTFPMPCGGYRTIKPQILKPNIVQGYKQVILQIKGVCQTYKVHRLVAFGFVENPNNYPEVNHLDGIKLNNYYTNLEWCNRSMNILHAVRMGLRDNIKSGREHPQSKQLLNTETGEIYNTLIEASKKLGVDFTTLSDFINKRKRNHSDKMIEKLSKLILQ